MPLILRSCWLCPIVVGTLSIFNDESDPSITFLYNVDDPMNPDDSLYNFLMELEKYVPDEDKDKIIPQWR